MLGLKYGIFGRTTHHLTNIRQHVQNKVEQQKYTFEVY